MKNSLSEIVFQSIETSENKSKSIFFQKCQVLSNKIENGMKKKQFNRQQFANLMGVQPSIITRWLSGTHNFTVETLFEIEEKLGIQLVAIDAPVYKEISMYMVVGSTPTKHPYTELVDKLSDVPSNVIYGNGDSFIRDNCSQSFLDFYKVID
jgi:transcriptional regulator with XRE-family HTH domain